MRILILWDVYPRYPAYFYARHPGLADQSYDQQLSAILNDFFYWPPYLIPEFRALGHEAEIVYGNIGPLQQAWAREHHIEVGPENGQFEIVLEQIKRFRPDVLWFGGADYYLGDFLHQVKPYCRRIVAWKAVGFSSALNWQDVDCVLSSHLVFIEQFRRMGVWSERILPCFEPRILEHLQPASRGIPASFIGTLSPIHFAQRMKFLNDLRGRVPLDIYAEKPIWRRRPWPPRMFLNQARFIPFLIRGRLRPAVYGLDMFQVLAASKIALNVHIDSANGQAGNIRMFEATGAGALLVTDAAANLSELFEPEREVVTYRSSEEAVEKIHYYLAHPDERQAIAAAAQRRTLRDYNATRRAQDVLAVFMKLL